MNDDRISEIFAAATDLEPAERDAYLARACADDEPLRDAVASLLANDMPDTLLDVEAPGGRRRPARPSPWIPEQNARHWWSLFAGPGVLAAGSAFAIVVILLGGTIVENRVAAGIRRALDAELQQQLQAGVSSVSEWFVGAERELVSYAGNADVRRNLAMTSRALASCP